MTTLLEAPPITRRKAASFDWLILFVAMLLAIAAGLKLWAFATTPSSNTHWTDKPLIVLGGSAFEILLASWLVSGWQRRAANMLAAFFFMIVTCIAASEWWSGELSCGCFGPLKVSPCITTFLDLGIFAGLLWQLFWNRQRLPRASAARIAGVIIVGITAAAVLPAIAYQYHPAMKNSAGLAESGGFIVLEPEKWIGKPFPLTGYITTPHSITQGACRVVLFHSDCPDCQRLLPQIEAVARSKTLRTVLVEIPPVAPPEQSIVPPGTVCELGTLDPSKEWFATTPVVLDLLDGRVVRQQAGAQAKP